MRAAAMATGAALAALVTGAAPRPAAADTVSLAELPEKPARYGQAKGPVPARILSDQYRFSLEPTADACLLSTQPRYWIDGDAELYGRWASLVTDAGEPFGVERLIVRGDTAELERVAVQIRDRALAPTGRSRIPLRAVASLPGLTVYAYRWAGKIFLLAPARPGATHRSQGSDDDRPTECSVAYAQLTVRSGSSEIAQIQGTVPSTGEPFVVDASVSQTSRDPAPLLSVTARLLGK